MIVQVSKPTLKVFVFIEINVLNQFFIDKMGMVKGYHIKMCS